MVNRSLPLVGTSKLQSFSFNQYPKKRDKIKLAVEDKFRRMKVVPPNLDNFFVELGKAIQWALHYQSVPKYSRVEVKKVIEDLWGAKTMEEVRERTPPPIRHWLVSDEVSIHTAKSPQDVNRVILALSNMVEKELTGRGRDTDAIPLMLAANIAHAMKKIGIKPVASRPTDSGNPSVFYVVVQECFAIASISNADPYEHMKNALKIQIYE